MAHTSPMGKKQKQPTKSLGGEEGVLLLVLLLLGVSLLPSTGSRNQKHPAALQGQGTALLWGVAGGWECRENTISHPPTIKINGLTTTF